MIGKREFSAHRSSLKGSEDKTKIRVATEKTIKDIRRATCKHHSAEDKIRIVLEELRGGDSIVEICRRKGISESLYCS